MDKKKKETPLIKSSYSLESRLRSAEKQLRRMKGAIKEREFTRLGADEIGTMRLLAGRVSEENLFAFVAPEDTRRRHGLKPRRLEDGDIVLISVSLEGLSEDSPREAVPLVMCWNEASKAFEDPITGGLFRLLVDCYYLLKRGRARL